MEGTMSEIRLFAGSFAPKNWAYCNGQIISIAQNQALFSLLGTTYGGNGVNTFALPDFRGRVAMGAGTTSGGTTTLGQVAGTTTVLLSTAQIPAHIHVPQTPYNPPAAPVFKVSSANATATAPTAGVSLATMGTPEGRGGLATVNAYNAATPDTPILPGAVKLAPIVELPVGGSQPHNNMQPWIGVPHVICMYGIYPSRN